MADMTTDAEKSSSTSLSSVLSCGTGGNLIVIRGASTVARCLQIAMTEKTRTDKSRKTGFALDSSLNFGVYYGFYKTQKKNMDSSAIVVTIYSVLSSNQERCWLLYELRTCTQFWYQGKGNVLKNNVNQSKGA